jgi:hypothetical protein
MVGLDGLVHRQAQIFDRVWEILDAQDVDRLQEAPQVVSQAKHRRTFVGLIAADALEDSQAVMERWRKQVNRRLIVRQELTVHPDQFRFHQQFPLSFGGLAKFSKLRKFLWST